MKMELKVERLKILGKGSYGVVHLLRLTTGSSAGFQLVAAKSANEADEAMVSSLRDEEEVLKQFIGSPYIVQYYGSLRSFDPDDDKEIISSMLLEYAWGGSVVDLMEDYGGKIPERDVKCYAQMILQGLVEIHQKGYVHSDLKPGNILVFHSEDCKYLPMLKIADFGLVKVYRAKDRRIWQYGFRGAAPYMSPESVIGKVSGALDIWSLGCIIVEMITGKLAWEYSDLGDLRDKLLWGEKPNIPENMSSLGKDFLMKCFAKDPKERWTATMLLHHPFLLPDQTLSPLESGSPSCTSSSCLSSTNPGDNEERVLGTGFLKSTSTSSLSSANSADSEEKLFGTADSLVDPTILFLQQLIRSP